MYALSQQIDTNPNPRLRTSGILGSGTELGVSGRGSETIPQNPANKPAEQQGSTGGKTRYYNVELRTNLLFGSWQATPSYSNIFGNGTIIVCTNATQDQAKFYRVKARLQP